MSPQNAQRPKRDNPTSRRSGSSPAENTNQSAEQTGSALIPVKRGMVGFLGVFASVDRENPESLPNASLIYGIGAVMLLVVALFFLLMGSWGRAVLLLIPAMSFLGFALHFLNTTK